MELGDLQRELAVDLLLTKSLEPGVQEAKRRRAAGHLLPRLRSTLGIAWPFRFHLHAERYTPAGPLHQVDDAWALAEAIERETSDPRVQLATHDDLCSLRLRYVRDPRQESHRIQERRGPLLALLHTPQRAMVVKLPGIPGRLWYLRM